MTRTLRTRTRNNCTVRCFAATNTATSHPRTWTSVRPPSAVRCSAYSTSSPKGGSHTNSASTRESRGEAAQSPHRPGSEGSWRETECGCSRYCPRTTTERKESHPPSRPCPRGSGCPSRIRVRGISIPQECEENAPARACPTAPSAAPACCPNRV